MPTQSLNLAAWFSGKEFSEKDYVSNKAALWSEVLEPLRGTTISVLEIGSLEGRSALFFLNYLPNSRVTCIDLFRAEKEARFDRNIAEFASRIRKLKGYSFPALTSLRQEGCWFDLIYIDACHQREAVLLDSVLSWPMLRSGGILIWDDYGKYKSRSPRWNRPSGAVDGFLLAHRGEFEQLACGKQMIVRKTVAAPRLAEDVFACGARRSSLWRRMLRKG